MKKLYLWNCGWASACAIQAVVEGKAGWVLLFALAAAGSFWLSRDEPPSR